MCRVHIGDILFKSTILSIIRSFCPIDSFTKGQYLLNILEIKYQLIVNFCHLEPVKVKFNQ